MLELYIQDLFQVLDTALVLAKTLAVTGIGVGRATPYLQSGPLATRALRDSTFIGAHKPRRSFDQVRPTH